MKGRFGLGGQADTGATSGLSLKYWVSDLGFQALFGFNMVGESSADAKDNTSEFDIALRLLFNFARANDTNMYVGAGVNLGVFGGGDNAPERDARVAIDILLGVEHYFTDFFSVAGHVGIGINTGDPFTMGLGSSSWGSSFHFYF